MKDKEKLKRGLIFGFGFGVLLFLTTRNFMYLVAGFLIGFAVGGKIDIKKRVESQRRFNSFFSLNFYRAFIISKSSLADFSGPSVSIPETPSWVFI